MATKMRSLLIKVWRVLSALIPIMNWSFNWSSRAQRLNWLDWPEVSLSRYSPYMQVCATWRIHQVVGINSLRLLSLGVKWVLSMFINSENVFLLGRSGVVSDDNMSYTSLPISVYKILLQSVFVGAKVASWYKLL